jgi:2-keto-3-deoxy-L-arabinonate dehydratase
MSPPSTIQGVLPVLHLSYNTDGSISDSDLAAGIDWVFANKADGCCLAMVTDLFRLTFAERIALNHRVMACVASRGPVVVSVGAESQAQAIAYTREAESAGASAVMVIPPLTSALGEDASEGYFRSIADATALPLIIQDASGYVGRPLSLPMQLRLFARYGAEKILFKPETNPIGPTVSRLMRETGGAARIFEGSGGLHVVETYRRGLTGIMPGSDLIDGIVALWKALRRGDEANIYRLYLPIAGMITLQAQAGIDGFMTIERHILKQRGVFSGTTGRPPLSFEPDEIHRREADRLLALMLAAIQSVEVS